MSHINTATCEYLPITLITLCLAFEEFVYGYISSLDYRFLDLGNCVLLISVLSLP